MIFIPYAFQPEVPNVYAHLALIIPSTMHTYPVFNGQAYTWKYITDDESIDPNLDI